MNRLQTWGREALDLVLPPQCFCCGARVADPARLCQNCFTGISFIADPCCHTCGLPFEFEVEQGGLCALCIARAPDYDHARAAGHYAEPLRSALLAFKHGDRMDMAPGLARLLVRAGRDLLPTAEIIAPVPLHPRRLWYRRYNQASTLADQVAEQTGVPAVPDLLIRKRRTRSQGGLSATARRRNVRGAFKLADRHRETVAGRHILLIDDVYTTGATAEACARLLKRAGAASVSVLTVARVVRSGRL